MSETIKLPPIPSAMVGWYTMQRPDLEKWGRLAVEQATAELRAECDALRAKYNDLILSVGTKFPGESRHETAKRYIHRAERMTDAMLEAREAK